MAGQRTLDPLMVVRIHQGQLDLANRGPVFWSRMLAFEAELAHPPPPSLIATVWDVFDRFPPMTWKATDDIDREVRAWMEAR